MAFSEILNYIKSFHSRSVVDLSRSIEAIPDIIRYLGYERSIREFVPYVLCSASLTEMDWPKIINSFMVLNISKLNITQITLLLDSLSLVFQFDMHHVRIALSKLIGKISKETTEEIRDNVMYGYILYKLSEDWPVTKSAATLCFAEMSTSLSKRQVLDIFGIIKAFHDIDSVLLRKYLVITAKKLLYINYLTDELHDLIVNLLSNETSLAVLQEVPSFVADYARITKQTENSLDLTLQLFKSDKWKVKYLALESLPSIVKDFSNTVYEFIRESSNDPEPSVRKKAVEILPKFSIEDLKKYNELISLFLEDDDENVVSAAVSAFVNLQGLYNTDEFVQAIEKFMETQSTNIRKSVISVINNCTIPNEDKIKIVASFFVSLEWREKIYAVDVIVTVASSRDIPNNLVSLIGLFLNSDEIKVRSHMTQALAKLFDKFNESSKEALSSILNKMGNSADYQIRQTALENIINLKLYSSECKTVLLQLCRDPVSNVRYVIASKISLSLQSLIKKLQCDEDEDIRDVIKERLEKAQSKK